MPVAVSCSVKPAARVGLGTVTAMERRLFTCAPPVMATTSWVLEAPFGIVSVPVVVPTTAGVKTTVTVQEAAAAREVVQVFAVMT